MRNHLGISQIGKHCVRAIWYDFFHCTDKQLTPEQEAILNYGHTAEPVLAEWLRGRGWTVLDLDKRTGKQWGVQDPMNKWFSGSMDAIGIYEGEVYVIDFKTCGAKYIQQFKRQGLYHWRPEYYHQVNTYVGFSGQLGGSKKITKGVVFAFERPDDLTPPDPDGLDKHFEVVPFDRHRFAAMRQRARDITDSIRPPARNESFRCRFCDHFGVCYGGALPAVNCRTCLYNDMQKGCQNPKKIHAYNPYIMWAQDTQVIDVKEYDQWITGPCAQNAAQKL